MTYIDFEELKQRVSIEQAVSLLNLDVAMSGKQRRGKCPVCEGNSDRNLVITPDKSVYYCFSDGKGGDQIALVAHIRGCSIKEAASFLAGNKPEEKKSKEGHERGFQPLDYLQHDHEAVLAVGLEPDDAEALGIGYAPRGVLRGTVAVPVRLSDGKLAGYIGITEAKLPPSWKL